MKLTRQHCMQSRNHGFRIRGLLCAVALFICLADCTGIPQAQTRGLAPDTPQVAQIGATNGKYYALVIGINNYQPPLARLKTAVNDAQAIGKLLHDRYGFQVSYLIDQQATRFNILNALDKYRNTLNENDNLLIYYAGHGFSDREAEKAYWLPIDADSGDSPNRIIADDLTTGVRVLPSRHVLIVSDSCYSGALSRDADAPVPSDGQTAFLARMLRSRSRTLMASGGDEPVSDSGSNGHSVFAFAILRALTNESQPMFTASDLFYGSVQQQVAGKSEQLPQYSIIRNSEHDEGDFVFTLVATAHVPPPPTAPPAAISAVAPSAVPAAVPDRSSTETKISGTDVFKRGDALYKARQYADALPLLEEACNNGTAVACTDVGWMYLSGLGVTRDAGRAVGYLRRACDGGEMRGCNDLGYAHELGQGIEKDMNEAKELYDKACSGGDPMACKNIGVMYMYGRGVAADPKHGVALLRTSCDGGYGPGCTELGLAYFNGSGVHSDTAQAAGLYQRGCDAADPQGCNNLGSLYLNGQGVPKDEAHAESLALQACNGGYVVACKNLGWMYENGRGTGADAGKAANYYRKACDGGAVQGCTRLGDLYEKGKGVGADLAQASALYHHGCDLGDPEACNDLGAMYFIGKGVTKDLAQAATLVKTACDQGYLQGCSNLGWLYENGAGVGKDTKQAEELYHKACEGGVDEGCKGLKRLNP